MKKLLGLAAVFAVASAPAFAATLHFGEEAKNNEKGLADGTVLGPNANIQEAVSVSSNHFAYLDHDNNANAGLGVCKVLVNTQCSPSSDDNVTIGEWVMLTFTRVQSSLSGLVFRNAGHNAVNDNDTLKISVNGGTAQRYSFADASADVFNNVTTIKFLYDDDEEGGTANEFYVNQLTTNPIPLPAGMVLLGTALGVFGVARRRKPKG